MRALAGAVAVLAAVGSLVIGTASASAASSGSCDPYVDGTVIVVACWSGHSTGATAGDRAGSTANEVCTFTALGEARVKELGLPWLPPRGKRWALMVCAGGPTGTGPQALLVSNATGEPEVTPRQLVVGGLGVLDVPYLQPATAPPLGKDGLVGLPEWFWVPSGEWHSRSVTVTAGPVWATVTAVPVSLIFEPGAGLSPVTCAGPGDAYDPHTPAGQQHTKCSYTYLQPSAGQPAGMYQASVTVTWRVSWTGSGGAGGVLDPGLAVPAGVAIGVAQAEALVTSR